MTDRAVEPARERRGRPGGGREARHAARQAAAHAAGAPFLTRALKPVEILDEEGLALLEHNADTILEEVGIIFRGDQEALATLHGAGADVTGELVRFPRGMCRQIVQASAPRSLNAIFASSTVSRARSGCVTEPMNGLSDQRMCE